LREGCFDSAAHLEVFSVINLTPFSLYQRLIKVCPAKFADYQREAIDYSIVALGKIQFYAKLYPDLLKLVA